jgi:hypothetical protein
MINEPYGENRFGDHPHSDRPYPDQRPNIEPIASERIAVDRKIFFLDLKENARGRFVKITEDVNGRRDTIMVPAEAFADFADAFARIVEADRNIAPGTY